LIHSLKQDRLLAERVERLMSIPGIGPITALNYCGLCGDQHSSADRVQRTPLSKGRQGIRKAVELEGCSL
jgi:transposase